MRILVGLTYYRPYLSGLTVYAARVAEGLAARGHAVTVLTSRHRRHLSAHETIDGVDVVRIATRGRLSKAQLMPALPVAALRAVRRCDVVHLHLPQAEGGLVAAIARVFRRPVVVTYHCDVVPPPSPLAGMVRALADVANGASCQLAAAIGVTSQDYARRSRFLGRFADKLVVVPPPVAVHPRPTPAGDLRARWSLGDGPVVAFVGRFAAEKGIDDLAHAHCRLLEHRPDATLVLAGEHRDVVGESVLDGLASELAGLGERVVVPGRLDAADLAGLYGLAAAVAVPSTNATESFGLVQAEAMLCGTPVVASDLPGVRVPVRTTGMGLLVPPRRPERLAAALLRVLEQPEAFRPGLERARRSFGLEASVSAYERLLEREGAR